jgi:glycosyltransferase involved in cell wall biosynthesis
MAKNLPPVKLLVLLKNIDGGTGTYLAGLEEIKKTFGKNKLLIKILVLERPLYRSVVKNKYTFFNNRDIKDTKYSLSIQKIKTVLKEFRWFKKEVADFIPDIVIASNPHAVVTVELGRILYGFKYRTIDFIHNNLTKVIEYRAVGYLRWPLRVMMSVLLKRSDEVVAVSVHLAQDLRRNFNLSKKPSVLPAVLPWTDHAKRSGSKKSKEKVFVSLARLDNQKDHETLIKAFGIVAAKDATCRLWIVGDGPLKKDLFLQTKKMALNNKVRFFGWLQNPGKVLASADIFVLSTKWEGFPLSLLEAMKMGIPCIASDCQYGPREILGINKYGLLVPVGDYQKLASEMLRLAGNRDLRQRYSKAGIKRAEFYSEGKMTEILRNIILRNADPRGQDKKTALILN